MTQRVRGFGRVPSAQPVAAGCADGTDRVACE